jgi:hypothetical protein
MAKNSIHLSAFINMSRYSTAARPSSHQYGQTFYSCQLSSIRFDIIQLPADNSTARNTAAASSHQYGQTFYSCQQSSIWPDILQLPAVTNMSRHSTAASSHQYGQIFYSCQRSSIQPEMVINMVQYNHNSQSTCMLLA